MREAKGKFPRTVRHYKVVGRATRDFCLFDMRDSARSWACRGIKGDDHRCLRRVRSPASSVDPRFYYQPLPVRRRSRKLHASRIYIGLRKTIQRRNFCEPQTSAPPPDEQAAIVRFLDWANGRLERAIRAKRKVIALLNEQKQAIIHRAVTRGLDPSVPLKPSGIPWLGDIPQHWEVRANKAPLR